MIKLTLTKEQHAAAILAYAETTLGLKIEMTEQVEYKWWAHEDGSIEAEFMPRKAYEKTPALRVYETVCTGEANKWWYNLRPGPMHTNMGAPHYQTERGNAYITFINGLEHKEGDEIPSEFSIHDGEPEVTARASWPGVLQRFKTWIGENANPSHDQLTWRILPTFKVTPEGCYWRWRCVTEDSGAPIVRAFNDFEGANARIHGEATDVN